MAVSTGFANSSLDASITGTLYVGLLVSGTEVSGGAYARQAVTWGAAASGTKANSADITFPTATAGWGTVDGWGLFSALSGGTALLTGVISPGVAIGNGSQYKFPAGSLTVTQA